MNSTADPAAGHFPNEIEMMVGLLYDAAERDATAERLQAMIASGTHVRAIARAAVEALRYQGEVRFAIVDDQEAQDDCGCGDPIVLYEGVWLHVYNPELTGNYDHDARPWAPTRM